MDKIVLDNVTVTNTSITFFNLTSLGSNFINTNETYDAVASFVGLDAGLTIFNVNTSTILFKSSSGNQDANITFSPGIYIRTITDPCSGQIRNILTLVLIITTLGVLIFSVSLFFSKGKVFRKIDAKMIIFIFIGVLLAVVFVEQIANATAAFCP